MRKFLQFGYYFLLGAILLMPPAHAAGEPPAQEVPPQVSRPVTQFAPLAFLEQVPGFHGATFRRIDEKALLATLHDYTADLEHTKITIHPVAISNNGRHLAAILWTYDDRSADVPGRDGSSNYRLAVIDLGIPSIKLLPENGTDYIADTYSSPFGMICWDPVDTRYLFVDEMDETPERGGVWRMPCDGGKAQRVSRRGEVNALLDISQDGRWLRMAVSPIGDTAQSGHRRDSDTHYFLQSRQNPRIRKPANPHNIVVWHEHLSPDQRRYFACTFAKRDRRDDLTDFSLRLVNAATRQSRIFFRSKHSTLPANTELDEEQMPFLYTLIPTLNWLPDSSGLWMRLRYPASDQGQAVKEENWIVDLTGAAHKVNEVTWPSLPILMFSSHNWRHWVFFYDYAWYCVSVAGK